MKRIVILLLLHIFIVNIYAVDVFSIHNRRNKTACCYYDSTLTQIALKLYPNKTEMGIGHEMKIIKETETSLVVYYGDFFYVKKGCVAVNNIIYEDEGFTPIYSNPTCNSNLLLKLYEICPLPVIGKNGDWLRININGVQGWIEPKYQCGSQRTTCH